MKSMEKLEEMLCAELEKIASKGELSAGSLETVHKLTDTIKNIDKIKMLKEGGYSKDDGMWRAEGSYDEGNSYRYRAANGRYARANYSEDDYSERRRYSRASGKEHMIAKLEDMLEDADPKSREAIEKCIKHLENA